MSKDNTIKQCVLICQPLSSDYNTSSFTKLGTIPVIDICINWLIDNGIKQIFMFYSTSSKNTVQEYSANLHKGEVRVHLNFVKSQAMTCFGDVMREIQFRNIISQDFLVLYADTVTNLNLSHAIETHMKKKAQLKNVVLTTILRDNTIDNKIHILTTQSNQILQIEQDNNKKFTLNRERINLKKNNVQFRRNLSHCQIYLCTVQVFKSFRENHQYRTMFEFIHGMLTSEVYEEKIIGHLLQSSEEAYRLNKSKDLYLAYIGYISNSFYPYTLSRAKRTNNNKTDFVVKNFNKIIFNNVAVPRETYISNSCYIGENCKIGSNVQIQKSVITSSCNIGNNVTLKNCIILQGCTIAENSKFENCLIQNINDTQQIKRFKIFPKATVQQTVTEPLFEQTPPPEESTFEEQLQQVLEDEPRIQMLNQLNSIRKHHNKSLHDFTKEMIKIISPKGVQGLESFAKDWGKLIQKIHENQNLVMDSLYYSCTNLPQYEKVFHIFLQYFYKFDWLSDFSILSWYGEACKKYPGSQTLAKCQKFIQVLQRDQESDEQSGSQQQEEKNGSQNNESKSSEEQNNQ